MDSVYFSQCLSAWIVFFGSCPSQITSISRDCDVRRQRQVKDDGTHAVRNAGLDNRLCVDNGYFVDEMAFVLIQGNGFVTQCMANCHQGKTALVSWGFSATELEWSRECVYANTLFRTCTFSWRRFVLSFELETKS